MSHTKVGPFTNGVAPALNAGNMDILDAQYDDAMADAAADAAALYGKDVRAWAPSTVYAAGQAVVNPSGDFVTAASAHTSGASYTSANWTVPYVRPSQLGVANGVATLGSDGKLTASQLPATSSTAAPNLTGTYSARPAATSVQTGTLYFASDTQEVYRAAGTLGSAGTSWAPFGPGGAEVGYVQSTTTWTGGGDGSIVDLPGMNITITVGERPFVLEFEGIVNGSSTGAVGEVIMSIYDGTTRINEAHGTTSASNAYTTLFSRFRISGLTPGTTKTYKLCANRGATVTGTNGVSVVASATYPMWLRAATL